MRRTGTALALAGLALGAVSVPAQATQTDAVAGSAVATAAAVVPTIRSNDYPENNWGAPEFIPGVFALSMPANTSAVGFAYSFGPEGIFPATGSSSWAHLPPGWVKAVDGKLRITRPTDAGSRSQRLVVRMFDINLNWVGAEAEYRYHVPGHVPGAGPSRREAENIAVTVTPGRTASGKTYGKGSISFEETDKASSTGARRYLLATGGNTTHGPEFAFPFAAEVTGYYVIAASLFKAKNFGKLQFFVVDAKGERTPVADPGVKKPFTFDMYSAKAERVHLPLTGLRLAKGKYRLVVKVVGRNPASVSRTVKKIADHGYAAAVDFLTIVPLYNTAISTFQEALNNNGIAKDGVEIADIGPSSAKNSLSAQALAKAGFGAGATKTIGGATFTMPKPNADGSDNVIAVGQTITVTPIARARNVDLLVLSTCGKAPQSPGFGMTMYYENEMTFSDNVLPTIPVWGDAPAPSSTLPQHYTLTKAFTLPYRNAGKKKVANSTATVYHLKLPINYADSLPLRSFRLPTSDTDLGPSCRRFALHVLAVTTSR
ncbi:hypothetical protein D1871_10495 [Nakamurella silvestris]|nr:hypothetical protein D1871_10495 [Nakamurella silvestris]